MNRWRFLPPLGVIALLGPAVFAALGKNPGEQTVISGTIELQDPEGVDQTLVERQILNLTEIARIDAVFEERPLFIEGRRTPAVALAPVEAAPIVETPEPDPPVEPAVESPPPPPLLPPEIELAGIVRDESGSRALIRNLLDGAEIWLQEGELIGEWTLAEISQGQVRLEAAGTEIAFKLFPDTLP